MTESPSHIKKKPVLRWVYGALCVIMMALIFWFSAMEAPESAKVSGQITQTAVRVVYPDYPKLDRQQQAGAFRLMERIVRKSAHFTEYTVLGALFALFFNTFSFRGRCLCAWGCTTLYAATDEWQQSFVEGRGPLAGDVMIDSTGALLGILVVILLLAFIQRKRSPFSW